jgi:hypothetical protein
VVGTIDESTVDDDDPEFLRFLGLLYRGVDVTAAQKASTKKAFESAKKRTDHLFRNIKAAEEMGTSTGTATDACGVSKASKPVASVSQ